jgi:hypothetical protein
VVSDLRARAVDLRARAAASQEWEVAAVALLEWAAVLREPAGAAALLGAQRVARTRALLAARSIVRRPDRST